MENLNLHKQRLFSLIIAGVALISLLLPWFSVKAVGGFGIGASKNGLNSWGLIALLGIVAVAIASFMGDKTKPYDAMYKKVALGGFGAIAGGALIYLIRVLTVGNSYVKASPGFGLIIGLLAGLAGLGFLLGMIKVPENKKPTPPQA